MPKGIPLTPEELNRRRHAIFDASVILFLKQGFNETSMKEIAFIAGMGKSSLYDYFKTKDEILLWSVEDQIVDLTNAAQIIIHQPLPAVDRLRQVIKAHFEFLVANRDFFMKLNFEVQRLKIESQLRIQEKRHIYQDLIRKLIDEGVREGTFRPVDSLLVARILIIILSPTVFTTRPSGSPQQMLDTALDIILHGIQA
jgi:TetR/AcrR family transcriptional regulator, cholesterol catabolism regulator